MKNRNACRVITPVLQSFQSIHEDFSGLSGADIPNNATHRSTLLLSFLLMLKLHLLAPPSDVLLLHTADGERSFRNILRHGGSCTDRGSTSHFDGSHQLHIRSPQDAA